MSPQYTEPGTAHAQALAHLAKLLASKFHVNQDLIHHEATLEELDLDSLAVAELFLTLQDDWDVCMEDDSSSAQLTLSDIVLLAHGSNTPPTGP